ncbi:MAG: hypothetical protein G01um101417_646, partial [Parcubacteria group bacterium Gr01-1014_17]
IFLKISRTGRNTSIFTACPIAIVLSRGSFNRRVRFSTNCVGCVSPSITSPDSLTSSPVSSIWSENFFAIACKRDKKPMLSSVCRTSIGVLRNASFMRRSSYAVPLFISARSDCMVGMAGGRKSTPCFPLLYKGGGWGRIFYRRHIPPSAYRRSTGNILRPD